MGPNEPHAYLFGECLECMSRSDNVVRAGLTTKFKDVSTLCNMLTYHHGMPDIIRGCIKKIGEGAMVTIYSPPVKEFEVGKIEIEPSKNMEYVFLYPTFLCVFQGEGYLISADVKGTVHTFENELRKGYSFFICGNSRVIFKVKATENFVAYFSTINEKF